MHVTFFFILKNSPCIVISVVEPQVGQMIDLGFSENEMMDECLPLILFDGDCVINKNVNKGSLLLSTSCVTHTYSFTIQFSSFHARCE